MTEAINQTKLTTTACFLALFFYFVLAPSVYANSTYCWLSYYVVGKYVPKLAPAQSAARRLISGLSAVLERVERESKDIDLPLEVLGQKGFRLPDNIITRGDIQIRQAIYDSFLDMLKTEMKGLSTDNKVKLLGWLSFTPNANFLSGIPVSLVTLDLSELTKTGPGLFFIHNVVKFMGDVSNYALDQLGKKNNPKAWQYVFDGAFSESPTQNGAFSESPTQNRSRQVLYSQYTEQACQAQIQREVARLRNEMGKLELRLKKIVNSKLYLSRQPYFRREMTIDDEKRLSKIKKELEFLEPLIVISSHFPVDEDANPYRAPRIH